MPGGAEWICVCQGVSVWPDLMAVLDEMILCFKYCFDTKVDDTQK